jgi:hypothetical protein
MGSLGPRGERESTNALMVYGTCMKILIAIVNDGTKFEPITLLDWPDAVPLCVPNLGDTTKYAGQPYGKVIRRSFNYSEDELTVELGVIYP